MLPGYLYTRNIDKAVEVNWPVESIIKVMSHGGWWDEHPTPRGYVDIQIERQIADGRLPDAARAYAHAVHFGGKTTAESLAIIRDRDCGHVGHDIHPVSAGDLPPRVFRNAWRRGHNLNIILDMEECRQMHWRRLSASVDGENKRRSSLLYEEPPIPFDINYFRRAIRNARDDEELLRIWPEGIPRP
jgi:hypothetical protein